MKKKWIKFRWNGVWQITISEIFWNGHDIVHSIRRLWIALIIDSVESYSWNERASVNCVSDYVIDDDAVDVGLCDDWMNGSKACVLFKKLVVLKRSIKRVVWKIK